MIGWITRRLLSADRIQARYHAVARPAIAEREAAHRAITFAELIDTPLLIVHVSSASAADEIARARARGLPIYGETCPQYLYLTQQALCAPSFEGNKFLCSPPLRTERDQVALWSALRRGDLQVVSSDHSAYNFEGGAASKTAGGPSTPFSKIPMGLPGLECRMPLMVSGALKGTLAAEACASCGPPQSGGPSDEAKIEGLVKAVNTCCTMPAKLYGLYPRKGTIEVGSDADIALGIVTLPMRLIQSLRVCCTTRSITPPMKVWAPRAKSRARCCAGRRSSCTDNMIFVLDFLLCVASECFCQRASPACRGGAVRPLGRTRATSSNSGAHRRWVRRTIVVLLVVGGSVPLIRDDSRV